MAKNNSDNKKPARYPNPMLLLIAGAYLLFMAYSLWQSTGDGSVTGNWITVSWIGCIAFIIIAIGLFVLAFKFDKRNKQAIDEALEKERAELDSIVFVDEDENATGEESNND